MPRAQLQHLAEEHEHGDDDGGVEVRSRPRPCIRKPAGNAPGATVATALYTYAAPVPMPMSVNMFGLR